MEQSDWCRKQDTSRCFHGWKVRHRAQGSILTIATCAIARDRDKAATHSDVDITISSRHTVPCHSEPPPGQQTVSRQGKHARLDLGIKSIKSERS